MTSDEKWFDASGAPLPAAGDAFLVPLGKDRFSFCWVIGFAKKVQRVHPRTQALVEADAIALAGANWFGAAPPTADELARAEVLVVTSPHAFIHSWAMVGRPLVTISDAPPPKKLRPLGKVGRATVDGLALRDDVAGWSAIESVARDECKWRQDEAAEGARADAERDAWAARRAARMKKEASAAASKKSRSLDSWTRVDLGGELDGILPKRRAAELTALVQKAARALAKLGRDATRAAKLAAVDALVVAINEWDARHGAIETGAREVLCTTIDLIGRAAGLRGGNFADKRRDW